MSGNKSRRKGQAGERELTGIFQEAGIPAVHGGSMYGVDADVTNVPFIHVECKRNEKFQLYAALEQAQRDAVKFRDGVPCVFHRSNRHPWVAVMTLTDWLEFYRAWAAARQAKKDG